MKKNIKLTPIPDALAHADLSDSAKVVYMQILMDLYYDDNPEAYEELHSKGWILDGTPVMGLHLYAKDKKKQIMDEETKKSFEKFWELYNKKAGKAQALKIWAKLSKEDREEVLKSVPAYVKAKPDPTYRKDPVRYLRHRVWEDEIYSNYNIPDEILH